MTTTIPATSVEILTVTPGMAREWLKQNDHNRLIRPRAVTDYARDMAAGAWLMNGEAIKRAADGTLLDGQHRLLAVIESGTAVSMLVITGLPVTTQETMDSGRKRNAGDALTLRGEVNASVLASILRRVWQWEQGDHRLNGRATPTTAELSSLLTERPEIRRSAEIAGRVHQQFRYMPQSVTGTAHHVFSRINGEETVWFFARLGDGAELPGGHPILTLRNRIISDRADGRAIPDYRLMAYLIRTWNAVRDGRELARIQQPADAPMPMPK
ncbi:hypothetical protein ACIGBH_27520 [Streptomyces sp. NPDC085929]|uniref:hypothetical protein n=1 Tax=Streptomyces sp. NPDC085929 TaxID=3365739 RepID=UPI0037D69144